MSQGGKYYKRRKQYYNRPLYFKAFSIKNNYAHEKEYTLKTISHNENIANKEIRSNYNDANKENRITNSNINRSSPIFNLSSDIVDNAYFIPKKAKTFYLKQKEVSFPSSTYKSNNYFSYLEDSISNKTMRNTTSPTCDESYSNCSCSTSDHMLKMSTRSTSSSFNPISQFTTDEFHCNINSYNNDQTSMVLLNENKHQMQHFAPLKEKDLNTNLNAHHITKKTSITNDSYNKFNLFDKRLNQVDNTEVLSVNVKISNNKVFVFKLKRFDDLFTTVKLFCEINKIEERFIQPLVIKSFETLNQIYQVINCSIENKDIVYLNSIKCNGY